MTTRDELQQRALAVPSRRRLFESIEQAPAARTVADLARELDLHPNTVRLHLDVLIGADLVAETAPARAGRGRPPVGYRATGHHPADAGDAVTRLVAWVAAALPSPADARIAGHRIGAASAAADDGHPSRSLFELLAAEGFEPAATPDGHLLLGRCPFAGADPRSLGIICALHRGIVESFGGDGTVASLDIADPVAGTCTVRFGTGPAQAAAT